MSAAPRHSDITLAALAEVGYPSDPKTRCASRDVPPDTLLRAFNLAAAAHGDEPFGSIEELVAHAVARFNGAGMLRSASAWRQYAAKWQIDWEVAS